jgi:hypothetical protein
LVECAVVVGLVNRTWKIKSDLHLHTNPAYHTFETKAFGWLACISAGSFPPDSSESPGWQAFAGASKDAVKPACMKGGWRERKKNPTTPSSNICIVTRPLFESCHFSSIRYTHPVVVTCFALTSRTRRHRFQSRVVAN